MNTENTNTNNNTPSNEDIKWWNLDYYASDGPPEIPEPLTEDEKLHLNSVVIAGYEGERKAIIQWNELWPKVGYWDSIEHYHQCSIPVKSLKDDNGKPFYRFVEPYVSNECRLAHGYIAQPYLVENVIHGGDFYSQ